LLLILFLFIFSLFTLIFVFIVLAFLCSSCRFSNIMQSLTYLLLDAVVTVLVCQNSYIMRLFCNLYLPVTNIMPCVYTLHDHPS